MFRKLGATAALAAGLMAIGSPALAQSDASDGDSQEQGLVNADDILNDNNVNVPVGVCGNDIANSLDVNVLAIPVNLLALDNPSAGADVVGQCAEGTLKELDDADSIDDEDIFDDKQNQSEDNEELRNGSSS